MGNKRSTIYGIGINDVNYDKREISYFTWHAMIKRCYNIVYQINKVPTYIGCSICDEWKYYSNFKKWYDINYIDGYVLDKDILIDGNKVYSQETCCFIPQYLNKIFLLRENDRGDYPIGVHFDKRDKIFQSYININGKKHHLGLFDNPDEAHNIWLKTKREYARKLAIDAYMNNEIDERIMNAIIKKAYNLK